MKRFLTAAALFLAGAAMAQESPWEAHFKARDGVIQSQAQLIGPNRQLLLGDSNTEMFWWGNIEGCPVINAGMGGATFNDFAKRAQDIAKQTRPSIVHIMLGTNNASKPESYEHWETMQSDLTKTVKAFKAVGAQVVLWPVPPFSDPFPGTQEKRIFINRIIQLVARATDSNFDWWWQEQIGPGGIPKPGALQADGVHFSSHTQSSRYYRINVWRQHIQSHTGVNGC